MPKRVREQVVSVTNKGRIVWRSFYYIFYIRFVTHNLMTFYSRHRTEGHHKRYAEGSTVRRRNSFVSFK